jgi:protein-S-isoprenylcysteine O-methyltransferase Ste14
MRALLRSLLHSIDLPPVWLALHVGLAWGVSWISPAVFGEPGRVLGAGLVGLGVLVTGAAAGQMVLARTTVIPRRTPGALVTSGLFSWSRNPIYLSDAMILLGAILWLDSVLALPLVASFIWWIEKRFIRDEEERLTLAFGAEFDLWASRTRRWIGRR